MKVAVVHRFYPMQGGVTTIVNQLVSGIKGENSFEIISQGSKSQKNVKAISAGSTLGFYFKALRYLKKEKFDVIHTHSSFAAFLAPFLKTKVILTVHGFEKTYEKKGWFARFKENQILCRLKILSYKLSDKLVAPSNLVKENLVKKYNISSKKIIVISNGTDTNFFKPMKVKKSAVPLIFQYTTSRRKGFDKLVEWVRILSKDYKFKVVVAGASSGAPKELESYFKFIGDVSQKDLVKVYNECEFGLLPSLYDPFGLTASEMMACNKPVIVSEFTGAKDLITNGKDGVVCTFEDFPKKIELFLKKPQLAKKMGMLGRAKVIRDGSSKQMIDKHLKLYRDLSQ